MSMAGSALLSGQMILTADAKLVFQTPGLEQRLRIYLGEPCNYTRYMPAHDELPAPVLKLVRQINGAANGACTTPPHTQISTAYGVITLEAKWLVPWRPSGRRRQGSKVLPHIGDDRTPRTPHSPCGACASGIRCYAGADESRHSTRAWQNKTGDRGRPRRPTLLGRGSHEKTLSDPRCSQLRRARHENMAGAAARRGAAKFAGSRMSLASATGRSGSYALTAIQFDRLQGPHTQFLHHKNFNDLLFVEQ